MWTWKVEVTHRTATASPSSTDSGAMPPSAFTSSEKSLIKTFFSSSSTKIITATPARVYLAHPTPDKWYYAGFEGALVFVREGANLFYFRLVDLKAPGKVVWDHELYEDFYFYEDKPYFHTFAGDECMIGLCYADEAGASQLYKKVQNRAKYVKSSSSSSGFGFAKKLTSFMGSSSSSNDKERSTKTPNTNDTQISEPQWNGLVEQLGSMGVSDSDIKNNEGFLRDLLGVREREQSTASASTEKEGLAPPVTSVVPMRNAPPPPPPSAPPSGPSTLPPVAPRPAAAVPPPPPARPGASVHAPPPSGGSGRAPPPVPSRAGVTSRGPPPPPPARPGASVMGGGVGAPPPLPPPPPAPTMGAGGPPPPPPPPAPAMGAGGPPSPPPPPPAAPSSADAPALNGLPAPQPGRDALLASIQGKSVKDLKKTDLNAPPPRPAGSVPAGGSAEASAESTGGTSGGDLASALASALNKRKGIMGGSDDEESDDDW